MTMKKIVTSLLAALTLGSTLVATTGSADAQPRWRHYPHYRHGGGIGPGGAAALGVLGGLMLGSALSQQQYYYEDEPVVVRRRPVRVYEEDYVVVKRRPAPRCHTIIKYDMYGKPYEWKDCN
jgi:hypothetical protein